MSIQELETSIERLEAQYDRLDHSGRDTTQISLELEALNKQLMAARKDQNNAS